MENGYIKLWRRTLLNGMIQNHKLWAFWCWCLLKASHKVHKVIVGYQEITLQPGQFVFGRMKAAKELGMSEKSIRTCLDKLKKSQNLAIKSASKYSIISIINWHTYQANDETEGPANRPARGQQGATYKNDKNVKEYINAQFELFYRAYPRKQGKQSAFKAWMKNPELSNGLFDTVMSALEKQKPLWKDKDFIPYPATWINGRRWEDETDDSKPTPEGWI